MLEATELLTRTVSLDSWLARHFANQAFSIAPASEDASFRRYFRVTPDIGAPVIVMDAPPEREDCRPFVKVGRLFSAAGVHVPEILAEDLENGYLLLSDLGTTTYLQRLDVDNAPFMYSDAIDALIKFREFIEH